MAGGFLSGLVAGVVVSGVALGTVSVLTGGVRPGTDAPRATAVDVPAASEFNRARADVPADLPEADGAPAVVADAPQVGAVAPDDLSAVGSDQTATAARPEPGGIDADLSAPQVPANDSGITPSLPDEAQTAMVAEEPGDSPAQDDGADISQEPAQPVLPETETGSGLQAADDTLREDGALDGTAQADTAQEDTATPQPSAVPQPSAIPDVDDMATAAPEAASAVDAEEGTTQAEDGAGAEDAAPSGTIGDMAENIETGRLPSVGTAPEAEASPETPLDPRAIAQFAADFENPEGKPLMSIVLIHDEDSPIGLDALAAFPYPLSFAVDAMAPGAAEAMDRYRAAGFEVLAIADLPEGADARDTETVMQTVFAAVPEAVGIIEGTGAGLQISRDASEQLAPILLETGHGLVLFEKGLGTAPKLIAREGVPVGTVFRDFDGNDQSATVIRRFLDQAAFKAGRDEDGGVIMLGRLRADTISALLLWGLQDRASSVALAPVSAVLLGDG